MLQAGRINVVLSLAVETQVRTIAPASKKGLLLTNDQLTMWLRTCLRAAWILSPWFSDPELVRYVQLSLRREREVNVGNNSRDPCQALQQTSSP